MAWRPYENLVEGELDNTVAGKVSGWMQFVGMEEIVKIDLVGTESPPEQLTVTIELGS